MALSMLRIAGGRAASLGLGRGLLLQKAVPVTGALVPRQSLMISPVQKARIYGPEEEFEKEDDVHHWTNERYIALALLPIIPTALAFPHPVMDTVLTCGVFLHTYWRLSGVCEDYIHGERIPKLVQPLVKILTVLAFGSMCYFNYTDVGFANAARMLYSQL